MKAATEFIEQIQTKSQQLYEAYYNNTKRFNQNHLANYLTNELTDFIYEKQKNL